MNNIQTIFYISLGAAAGANARFFLTDWAMARWGGQFPWGTFLINLTGSFILGFILARITMGASLDPRFHRLLLVGFLGSYTTFSTYANEGIALLLDGRTSLAAFYLFGSAALGGTAAAIGMILGRWSS